MSEALIKEAKDFFAESESHEGPWRDKWGDDLRFRALDQWPEESVRLRQGNADEPPRPTMVFDQCDQYIRQIVNDMRLNPISLRALPMDDKADVEVAERLQGLFRYIEAVSRAKQAYWTAGDWAATTGRGYIRVYSVPIGDPKLNRYEPRIGRIANALTCYFDPLSVELDGSDATDAILVVEMNKNAFKRKYGVDCSGWNLADSNGWVTDNSVRIAEWHSVREGTKKVVADKDGEYSPDEYKGLVEKGSRKGDGYREEDRTEKTAWIRKLTSEEVLEETDFAGGSVGLIPVYGIERYTPEGRDLRGAIRAAKDPQRLLNFLGSNFAEAASAQARAQWVAPVGAISGHEHIWDNANRTGFPYLPYNDRDAQGVPLQAPARNDANLQLMGFANAMQFQMQMVQGSLGQYQGAIGAPSQETSRVALDKREQQSDTSTFHYNDNLGISVEQAGRIIMRMIPKLYDVARIQKILGEDGESAQVMIDPRAPAAFSKRPGPDGKTIDVLNPNIGEYDIQMSIGPSFTTKREEAAARLAEVINRPNSPPIYDDLYFSVQDSPIAKQLAKRAKIMLPPEIKAAEEQEGDVPPEVTAIVGQLQQMLQGREQQIQQGMSAMGELADKVEKAVTDMKVRGADLKVQEAEFQAAVAKFMAQQQMQEQAAQHQAQMGQLQDQAGQAVMQAQGEAQQQIQAQQEQGAGNALAELAQAVQQLAANQAQGNQILLNLAGVQQQQQGPMQ